MTVVGVAHTRQTEEKGRWRAKGDLRRQHDVVARRAERDVPGLARTPPLAAGEGCRVLGPVFRSMPGELPNALPTEGSPLWAALGLPAAAPTAAEAASTSWPDSRPFCLFHHHQRPSIVRSARLLHRHPVSSSLSSVSSFGSPRD